MGELELNRNPENYFQDVEQAAFNPANIVPGIGFSPDRMLQGRLFAYGDAQRYRLGVNHWQIPVNKARGCPFLAMFHRDGAMRIENQASDITYEPNTFGAFAETPSAREPDLALSGAAQHYDFREYDNDFYTQAGNLFRLLPAAEKERLFANTARAMAGVPDAIRTLHAAHCWLADKAYGEGIAKALKLELSAVEKRAEEELQRFAR